MVDADAGKWLLMISDLTKAEAGPSDDDFANDLSARVDMISIAFDLVSNPIDA